MEDIITNNAAMTPQESPRSIVDFFSDFAEWTQAIRGAIEGVIAIDGRSSSKKRITSWR